MSESVDKQVIFSSSVLHNVIFVWLSTEFMLVSSITILFQLVGEQFAPAKIEHTLFFHPVI